jgi:hypothetical protein
LPAWRRFRETRIRAANSCDAESALAIIAAIPEFLDEALHLCAEPMNRAAQASGEAANRLY